MNGIGNAWRCIGIRGDVIGDGADLDIVDLTCVVDFMFGSGCDIPCPDEADPNGDGENGPDIIDLTFIVDFMFGTPPDLVPCIPCSAKAFFRR